MSKRIVIHIGLHKTGTSYLQDVFFPSLPNVEVVRGWFSHRDIIKSDLNKRLIITDESLSGNPFRGNYLAEFEENIKKIKRIYNNPIIIFGIRQQSKFMLSLCKQYLHEGGSKPVNYLYNLENSGKIKNQELLLIPKLELLTSTFSDIFVYSQETLKHRSDDFERAISSFLNIEKFLKSNKPQRKTANVGLKTVTQANLLRRLNRLSSRMEQTKLLPSLHNKWFRKFGITPTSIVLIFFKNVGKQPFELDKELKEHLEVFYKNDWEQAQKYVSY